MSGDHFPPVDAATIASMLGVQLNKVNEHHLIEWLRQRYRSVYVEGWRDGQLLPGLEPGDEYK